MGRLNLLRSVFILLLAGVLGVLSSEAYGTKEEESWQMLIRANAAYEAANYSAAAEMYESVLKTGVVNGGVLFNLGNAYYRQNRIGESIAAYRGASRFLPRDAEVAANLEYARKRRADSLELKSSALSRFFFWANWASLRELVAISSIGISLSLMVLLLKKRFAGIPVWLGAALLSVSFVSIMTATLQYLELIDEPAAVVTAPEVSVKSGNAESNVTLFVLHAGAEVLVKETRGEWVQIALSDGRKGWVRQGFLVSVLSPS
jgi:tetratricopeptide (TPR) repeat protein